MPELKLVYGRQSNKYNHFEELQLESIRAINTRLMGVVAIRTIWRSKDERRSRFYQVIHLDYSEYGVDDYQEFDCVPGSEDYSEKKEAMQELWNHYIGVMGGEVVTISAPCLLKLLETALPLAGEDVTRQYDNEENKKFRRYALMRIGMMMDAMHEAGFSSDKCSVMDAIELTSPPRLSANETINYFVMRMVDRDFTAAAYLSTISMGILENCELASPGIQTLVRCNIERGSKRNDPPADGESFPFRCRITTLAKDSYYHMTFVIWLNGNYRSRNPLVTDIRVGSVIKMSDYEAALQMNRPEYLTVFGCKDSMMEGFDAKYIGPLAHSTQTAVPNGWLYTAYKGDNSHVDSSEYRLNDDVYGFALLTIAGELVLMSHDVRNISMLDDATIFSLYSSFISTKGRYRIDNSVFQMLCQAPGAMFEDLVEPE